jgi:hypothetical protein
MNRDLTGAETSMTPGARRRSSDRNAAVSSGGRLQFLHVWEVVVGLKPQPGGEATRCGGRRR